MCVCVKMSSSPGNYSLPNCLHSTGADELRIQLWLADMKISPDLAGVDYAGSLPRRGATARSMPCDPVRPISPIRIYGPPDGALGWMRWVPAVHTHTAVRGCPERCETLVFQVSDRILQLFLSVNELYLPRGHIEEVLQGPPVTTGS